jgi:hypothetical protein
MIRHGKLYKGCEHCINSLIQGNENARRYDRERMKRDYAQDLIQPFEKDYVKQYGAEKAREAGWNEESIRKYS